MSTSIVPILAYQLSLINVLNISATDHCYYSFPSSHSLRRDLHWTSFNLVSGYDNVDNLCKNKAQSDLSLTFQSYCEPFNEAEFNTSTSILFQNVGYQMQILLVMESNQLENHILTD